MYILVWEMYYEKVYFNYINLRFACCRIQRVRQIGGGKKTIFIYMCGSNQETKQGLAGKNIDEILKANIGSDINVVIETGGAQTWRSHDIDNSAIECYG